MKRKNWHTLIAAALAALIGLSACGPSQPSAPDAPDAQGGSAAEGGGEQTFVCKIANNTPESSPRSITMKWFAEELEKRSDGRIKTDYYPNGVLGADPELFQMTQTGAIQSFRGGGWNNLPGKLTLWSLPFMFRDYDELKHFQQSDFAHEIMEGANSDEIVINAIGYYAFRQLQTKFPVEHPADLQGKKMRVPSSPAFMSFYKACGASIQQMASTDVYMALSTGTIDGTCNLASNNYPFKIQEVTDYFVELNYAGEAEPVMTNAAWYRSLPEDLKTIYDECSEEMMRMSDDLIAETEAEYCEKIEQETAHTVKVAEDPEWMQEWADATMDYVRDDLIAQGLFTREDYDKVLEIVTAFRESKQ